MNILTEASIEQLRAKERMHGIKAGESADVKLDTPYALLVVELDDKAPDPFADLVQKAAVLGPVVISVVHRTWASVSEGRTLVARGELHFSEHLAPPSEL